MSFMLARKYNTSFSNAGAVHELPIVFINESADYMSKHGERFVNRPTNSGVAKMRCPDSSYGHFVTLTFRLSRESRRRAVIAPGEVARASVERCGG